jgi:tripartite-type tricarboxylate transporter receptor subunit TctC
MTEMNRRRIAGLAFGASMVLATGSAMPDAAVAQAWPERPVMLTLPYPAGGTNDTEARIVGEPLSAKLGQPIIIQSKPGATGGIASDFVARSQPDGYTLLFASSAQTTIVPLTQKINYNLDDLIAVSAIINGPMVLAINSGLPAKNLNETLDLIRAHPGKYNYASGGTSSVGHLVGALFVARAKLDMLHVPYRGGGPAVIDLMSGQVAMYFGNAGELLPHTGNERIRIIGVSSRQRMNQLPDVPAISEILPGFELTAWRGFMAPSRTPKVIIDKLAATVQAVSKEPDLIEKLSKIGDETITTTTAQHAEMIRQERGIYAEAIKAAGLKNE